MAGYWGWAWANTCMHGPWLLGVWGHVVIKHFDFTQAWHQGWLLGVWGHVVIKHFDFTQAWHIG